VANIEMTATAARQVELIISRLDSLSTLPEVATSFLSALTEKQFTPSVITEIIESDPALTAKVFSLAYDQRLSFSSAPTVKEALQQFDRQTISDIILSIKVFQDSETGQSGQSILSSKDLALHSLATACCAHEIANLVLDSDQRSLAFSAGLLHDIGKLAIAQVMPKSFARIAAEAKERSISFQAVEHKYLGLDHTIIGKRLAQKWHLPDEITFAIWLHHSDTEALSQNIKAGKLAQIVRLADIIATQSGIGASGSWDTVDSTSEILDSLKLTNEQIHKIKQNLDVAVDAKCSALGIKNPDAAVAYSQLLRERAARLASDNHRLNDENRRLATSSAHMQLVSDFLIALNPEMSTLQVSEIFASCWQKYYQTGPVCVVLADDPALQLLEVVTLNDSGDLKTILTNVPDGIDVLPQAIQNKFTVLEAGENSKWLLDQLDFDIKPDRAFIIPLLTGQRATGVVVFEQRLPVDPADQAESLAIAAGIAASVIAMTNNSDKHSRLAEQFADLLGQLKITRDKLAQAKTHAGIAEMAAGASHELNNPLAVISGRTQLLLDIETDENKKQMLKQINERASEVSEIVQDLMAFARPKQAFAAKIAVDELIDPAVAQAAVDYNLKNLELALEDIHQLPDVNVDANQVTTAIKNILSNSLDSYNGGNGPITISGNCLQQEDFVTIQIIDQGCGMDLDTLQKAAQPFFSSKQAGRQRGMGLAHARRLLELNNATLSLQSTPSKGTKAVINLPKA